jgi:diguanylate cyclase (GGDEF)-like protein
VLSAKPQRTGRRWLHFLTLTVFFGLIYLAADWGLNKLVFSEGWTILWPLNGVTIAVLLRRRRRDWPAILLGVAIGTGFGEYLDDSSVNAFSLEIWQRLFSVTEVAISASLLPRFASLDRWLRTPHIFLRFVAALVLGPSISGVMAAMFFHQVQGQAYLVAFNNWATADAIGIAVTMPLMLSLRSPEMLSLFRGRSIFRTLGAIACALAVSLLIFGTNEYPLLFLLYPALLFVDSLLAFPGAALALGGMCLIAVHCTTHGWGPFGHWPRNLLVPRDLALQIYLGFHMVALFPASLLFMERKRMAERLSISNARLERLASLDGLTAIPNRRSLDDQSVAEWKRAIRTQTPLALLMIDIDHFKQFNDMYGHLVGDQCLQAVASALAGCVRRPEDFVARYGGEEFAVLLPNTDLDGALSVAGSLRAAVADLAIEHRGGALQVVTVSIGCAVRVPQLEQSWSELFHMADVALYRAKKDGRNRVATALKTQAVG